MDSKEPVHMQELNPSEILSRRIPLFLLTFVPLLVCVCACARELQVESSGQHRIMSRNKRKNKKASKIRSPSKGRKLHLWLSSSEWRAGRWKGAVHSCEPIQSIYLPTLSVGPHQERSCSRHPHLLRDCEVLLEYLHDYRQLSRSKRQYTTRRINLLLIIRQLQRRRGRRRRRICIAILRFVLRSQEFRLQIMQSITKCIIREPNED